MKLSAYILGREVAVLESVGDFKSVLTYDPHTPTDDFVSLTMPVRTESYVWDDQLPPILQMNLPEGYLLQVLQEQFGPQIGASPIALLSIIGRNMVGRIQVAAAGAVLNEPAKPIEVAELLQGDNSEQAFAELVRQHAASGVSGVLHLLRSTNTSACKRLPRLSPALEPRSRATEMRWWSIALTLTKKDTHSGGWKIFARYSAYVPQQSTKLHGSALPELSETMCPAIASTRLSEISQRL
jgi:HipA-like protein